MPRAPSSRRRLAIHLFAAISLLATAPFWPASAGAQTATPADIATRDQLIYDQESLLNVYRCRFDIDTLIVRGGCANGVPVRPAAEPDLFAGTPNANEIYVRDSLIASQESLLNDYRCRFDIDTEVVPGGCADGQPVESAAAPVETNASTTITSGSRHSCAIKADGSIACWGNNGYGQSDPPPGRYTAIAAGDLHSCAIRTDSTIACWGDNGSGQSDPPPGQFTAVAAGNVFSCAIRADGTIACWGINSDGRSDPPPGHYTAISAGNSHSCAIRADDTVACWGRNDSGQADPPSGQYAVVEAGTWSSCAIKADNTVTCWGSPRRAPILAPQDKITAIAAGFDHW